MNEFLQIVFANVVVALLLAIAVAALGRIWRRPAVLHVLWLLVLVKLVTPPIFHVPVWLPAAEPNQIQMESPIASAPPLDAQHPDKANVAVAPSPRESAIVGNEIVRDTSPEDTETTTVASNPTTGHAPPKVAEQVSWLAVLLGVWLAGSLLYALLVTRRITAFVKVLKRAADAGDMHPLCERLAAAMGLRRAPRILMLPGRISPAVWPGLWHPTVLLPGDLFAKLDARSQETILAHELAHVRRLDHWIRKLELLVTTLFWWHPVVWWARRELRSLEEECCDAEVVRLLAADSSSYARALVQTVDFLAGATHTIPVTSTGLRPTSSLRRRVQLILAGPPKLQLSRTTKFAMACLAPAILAFSPFLSQQAREPAESLGDVGSSNVLDQLASTDPQKRVDLYGDPLPDGAIARAGTIRFRPQGHVQEVAFSADGKQLFSWTDDGQFSTWDVPSGKLLRRNTFANTGLYALSVIDAEHSIAVLRNTATHLWDFVAGQAPPDGRVGPLLREVRKGGGFGGRGFGGRGLGGGGFGGGVFGGGVSVGKPVGSYSAFAVSPDGSILAGSRDGVRDEVQLWDLESGKTLGELTKLRSLPFRETLDELHEFFEKLMNVGDCVWLRFTDDGSRVVVICQREVDHGPELTNSGGDSMVFVWDVETGAELLHFTAAQANRAGRSTAAEISPMGSKLAIGGSDQTIHVFDLHDGKPLQQIACDELIHSLAFTPTGRLISGGRSNRVRVWNVATGNEEQQFSGHRSWIECLAVSPDGKTVASGAQDNTIRLWNLESGAEVVKLSGHDYWLLSLAVSSDGELIATGSADQTVCFWEGSSGKLLRRMPEEEGWVASLALSTDDKTLAIGRSPGGSGLKLVDVTTGELLRTLGQQEGVGFNSLSFSLDGTRLVSGTGQGRTVKLWDVQSGTLLREFEFEADPNEEFERTVRCVAISPDGKIIASSDRTGMGGSSALRLWSAESGELLTTIAPLKGNIESIRFSAEGKQIVTGGWSSRRGFTTDNRDLSSADFRDSVQLWDVQSGQLLGQFPAEESEGTGGSRGVNDVAISPDGELIVTAERGGRIEIYNAKTRRHVTTLRHSTEVRNVRFSADGRRLVTTGSDLSALVWDASALPR